MFEQSSQPEKVLRDRTNKGGFTVALSGGGHHASFAILGAPMANVDRNVNAIKSALDISYATERVRPDSTSVHLLSL